MAYRYKTKSSRIIAHSSVIIFLSYVLRLIPLLIDWFDYFENPDISLFCIDTFYLLILHCNRLSDMPVVNCSNPTLRIRRVRLS